MSTQGLFPPEPQGDSGRGPTFSSLAFPDSIGFPRCLKPTDPGISFFRRVKRVIGWSCILVGIRIPPVEPNPVQLRHFVFVVWISLSSFSFTVRHTTILASTKKTITFRDNHSSRT